MGALESRDLPWNVCNSGIRIWRLCTGPSMLQRKVLTPNDFNSLAEVEHRLLAFQRHYQSLARPFTWTSASSFTHGSTGLGGGGAFSNRCFLTSSHGLSKSSSSVHAPLRQSGS